MGNLASKDEGNGDGAKLNTTSAGPSGPFTHSAGPARDEDVAADQDSMEVEAFAPDENDLVPVVFTWSHSGRQVYITGTFNSWQEQIPMFRSGNDFTYIHNLTRGKHVYKFIVDDEWRFAPDQPTVADVEGNINNYIDVTDFQPYKVIDDEEGPQGDLKKMLAQTHSDNQIFGRFVPDIDDYNKEPPQLPPHLRHIILNKLPSSSDPCLLPVPQHVALNHLYCTAIKDGMMVLGITQRYKRKFVTTVFYSMLPRT